MRITIKNDTVIGHVDYEGRGERDVITLYIDFGEIKVGSSMCMPTKYTEAKLVLACMNEAFTKAEQLVAQ